MEPHFQTAVICVILLISLLCAQVSAIPGRRSVPAQLVAPQSSSSSSGSSDYNGLSPSYRLASVASTVLSSSTNFSKPQSGPDALDRLSKVFGLSRIPRHAIHRSPPQYMKELYAAITDTGGLTRARGPYNSNTIRSFPDKDVLKRWHFHYNISYLEQEEQILQAEFHLFKLRSGPGQGNKERRSSHVIFVKVYQVMDNSMTGQAHATRLLDARRISAHAHGWQVFNVTSAVLSWHYEMAPNLGFLVTAETLSGSRVNDSFVRFAQRNEHHDSKQPALVIFAEDVKRNHANYISPQDEGYREMKEDLVRHEIQKKRRQKSEFRDVLRMLNERGRRKETSRSTRSIHRPEYDSITTSSRLKRSARKRNRGSGRGNGNRRKRTYDVYRRYRKKNRSCSRYEMFVDFEEIGWSGWIISPNSYNAYLCSGECPFPLGQSQKPTNHATVQSIVNALAVGKNVGTPCCVPDKLYSISLLYFDDNENVILKQYDDMVVASCGCH